MDDVVAREIQKTKTGDRQAFGVLIDLYQHKVYQICLRMVGNHQEAEDLAQETFLRAYLNIDSYETDKKFSSWLYRIATNVSIDRLRKRKPDAYLDAEVTGTQGLTLYHLLADNNERPEDQLLTLEVQENVQKQIARLPPKYRSAIVLKYMEDLSLQEVSEVLDIPVSTVKTRLYRAREILRRGLRHI